MFLAKASEMFNGKSELTRSELVQVANEMDMKYAPSWIVKNDEYKMGNGLYSLFAGDAPVAETPVMNVPEQPQAKKQIAISDTTIHNLIPAVYANYVPFGQFQDVKSIIKSKMFYPIFCTGLSGNGKTMMFEQVCAALKREFFRVNITIETDEDDLLGGYRLVDGETVWYDGPVVQAMKAGGVLLLDEIDLASNKIMCLQPILEGNGILLKKINQFVEPAEGFQIVATANTKGKGSEDGRFIGTNILNEAFLERFAVTIEQPYASPSVEKKIVIGSMKKYGAVDEDFATNLVTWSEVIRKTFYDGGVDELISTRRLDHIVKAFAIFKDKMKSIEMCVARFDDDTKESFMDLYTKIDAGVNPLEENTEIPTVETTENTEPQF